MHLRPALALLLGGFGAAVAGLWLVWDLVTTIVSRYTGPQFADFRFHLPFFLVTADVWTWPFDLGLALVGGGLLLVAFGAYAMGHRE